MQGRQGRTPDRNNMSAGSMRTTPNKSSATMKNRYLRQGQQTSQQSQEQQFTEAKRILNMHVNYLSKGCYKYFGAAIARYDDDAMALLKSYRNHENSD